MKKHYAWAASLLLLLVTAGSLEAQVQNGSFETWSGSSPSAWTTIDPGITLTQSTGVVKAGSASAGVTVATTTQSNTDLRQTVSVTPGVSYTFSVWVYHTEGGLRARLYAGDYRGYSSETTLNSWQQLSYTFTPSVSTVEVGLRFYDVSGFDGSAVVYVDDFQPASSGGGGGPACEGTAGTLSLTTDNYASETSWQITSGATVVYSGASYSNATTYTEDLCLGDGSYTFTIYDSYGDGICCSYGTGAYTLTVAGATIISGGSFGASESVSFTVGGSGGGSGGGASGSGYYASVNGLSGYLLKTELHNIIDDHSSQGYSALWSFYNSNERDYYYENDGSILDIYSEKPAAADSYSFTPSSDQCGTYSAEGDCYNREHSFPRSWFGGEVEPMNSDVHHIFATDGYVNGRRSSYPYGEVGSATYTSSNGCKLGAGSGIGYTGTVFEPIDAFKGDLARAYFYMATRYEDVISGWEANNSYVSAVLDGTGNHVFENWTLSMLLDWHTNDPVSAKEMARNDAAYAYQGNRNPFVDHPEYVGLIWSGSSSRLSRTLASESSEQILPDNIRVTLTGDALTINFARNPVKMIQVMDITGRVIHRAEVSGRNDYSLVRRFDPDQIYLINMLTPKDMLTRKLIIR